MSALVTGTKSSVREPMFTKDEHDIRILKDAAAKKRKDHADKQSKWVPIKADIDSMNADELLAYISESLVDINRKRIGLCTLNVNPYEYAIIKLSMEMTGARSLRDLIVSQAAKTIDLFTKTSK